MTISTLSNPREDFLARRRAGIGGSDVAAILGMSKWKTALDVYLEKRGLVEDQEATARMEMGNFFEAPILDWYARTCPPAAEFWRGESGHHSDFPFLLYSLDMRVSTGEVEWIVDAKNVHFRAMAEWGEDGSDEIPLDALFQAHHYLACHPKAIRVDFGVLRGGFWPPRVYTVPRDEEMYGLVLPQLSAFWHRHVVPGVPPPADFADEKTLDSIKALFPPKPEKTDPIALPNTIEISGQAVSVVELLEAHALLKRIESESEKRAKRVEAAIRQGIGDNRAGGISTPAGDIIANRIFNKGGPKPASFTKPYDYLQLKFPAGYTPTITPARIAALLEEGDSNV